MLFQSCLFLFLFLPVTLGVYLLLPRLTKSQAPLLLWLLATSFIFYAYWSPKYALLLFACIFVNFFVVQRLREMPWESRHRTLVLLLGVGANLLLLCYYKYGNYWIDILNERTGTSFARLIFPIGISFYTFVQIGCLIDAYNGQIQRLEFLKYMAMGVFFPCIMAGPIVQQHEMLTQMNEAGRQRITSEHIAAGLSIFLMGLFKKLVLADNIAPYANAFFTTAETGGTVSTATAWLGICTYALQVYYDFSGYSDLAVGLGQMFGIRLPQNFNSPLRATSVIEFWRSWHITMTRFFTNYIYSPMAADWMRQSMRRGYSPVKRFWVVVVWPMCVTFTLAGIWHGVGWVWVVYGICQGMALTINHGWRQLQAAKLVPEVPGIVGWALTMVTFFFSSIWARSDSVPTALHILRSMAGLGADGGVGVGDFFGLTTLVGFQIMPLLLWVIPLLAIALLLPNSNELLERYEIAFDMAPRRKAPLLNSLVWRPTLGWALVLVLATMVSFAFIENQSPFIYYKF